MREYSQLNQFLTENAIDIALLNIVSTFVFMYILLLCLRPSIKISKYICHTKYKDEEHNKEEYYYVFKLVNMSKFDLYNIEIKLHLQTPIIVNNGSKINFRLEEIPLNTNNVDVISRYKKEKGYGEHAFLIRTQHNILKDIGKENTKITLGILGRHGFSNLQKMVTKTYTNKNKIKEDHEFKFGKSLDVIQK